MNDDLKFLFKVARNAGILAGLMFVSTYATQTLTYTLIKPIIVFFAGYVFTELARYYKITPQNKKGARPLIY